jgi:anaerobic selenocysteine-containing dehydrogenase
MRVDVVDGRLRAIETHPENRATADGVCLKGLSYIERVYSPDRLLHPLIRDRRGSLQRASWQDVLDLVATRLETARSRWGAQSVAYITGSGTKGLLNGVGLAFWKLFGGCTTTYGDLCWPAGLEATRLTLGDNRHNAPWDLAHARLILFWGKNPAETNIHQMRFVETARDRGARVVVIDPRRTETAEHADHLLQIRPGTDGALALGLARQIIVNGQIDRAFIDGHVLGFEEFAAMVEDYTPDSVAAITGIPEEEILRLATDLGTIAPATLCAGFGMQRYTNSTQTMRALIALLALTGNLGKPGAGWVYANLQSHIFSATKDPLAFYPPERSTEGVRVSLSITKLGQDLLAQSDPPVQIAWIERGNPVPQCPETPTVLRAFRSLDFRIVVDQFLTDTAREADVVLPAKTMFEQTDVIHAYWHPYIQLKQKVIEPPGEVKPESEIFWLLARRLGFPEESITQNLPEPGDAGVEAWLEERLAPFPGLCLARLRQGPVLSPDFEEVAFAEARFPTPSGKVELLSMEAQERWGADPLPRYREPRESSLRTDADPRHPFHLLTPNTKNRIHSQFGNLASIRSLADAPVVFVHPQDAAHHGLRPGDRVRVFNERGELRLEARFDAGLLRGCLCITNGWWLSEGGAVNLLSKARETDMAHGAAFHDIAVGIERVKAP